MRLLSVGKFGTTAYRLFLQRAGKNISPWHDVPLFADSHTKALSFVCEIPKGTTEKFEIDTKAEDNPLRQDLAKDGTPRHYRTGPMFVNYGAFPQTWESPLAVHREVGGEFAGDNDPLDVFEIGTESVPRGTVLPVRLLGALCLIDQGEVDWKVITVRVGEPLFDGIDDMPSLQRAHPHVVPQIREWLRTYKRLEGKPDNIFGHRERALDRDFAMSVVNETHSQYKTLRDSRELQAQFGLWFAQHNASPTPV